MKLIYTINEKGYVAVIEKAPFNTTIGVLSPSDPLVFCMQDDLLKYYPSKLQEISRNSLFPVIETPVIDVRSSLQAHIDKGLLSSDVLDLLPVIS